MSAAKLLAGELERALVNSEGRDFEIDAGFVREVITALRGEGIPAYVHDSENAAPPMPAGSGVLHQSAGAAPDDSKDAARYRARRFADFYTSLSCTGTTEEQFNASYDERSDSMIAQCERRISGGRST